MPRLAEIDPDVAKALREEAQRQHRNLELIARTGQGAVRRSAR